MVRDCNPYTWASDWEEVGLYVVGISASNLPSPSVTRKLKMDKSVVEIWFKIRSFEIWLLDWIQDLYFDGWGWDSNQQANRLEICPSLLFVHGPFFYVHGPKNMLRIHNFVSDRAVLAFCLAKTPKAKWRQKAIKRVKKIMECLLWQTLLPNKLYWVGKNREETSSHFSYVMGPPFMYRWCI